METLRGALGTKEVRFERWRSCSPSKIGEYCTAVQQCEVSFRADNGAAFRDGDDRSPNFGYWTSGVSSASDFRPAV